MRNFALYGGNTHDQEKRPNVERATVVFTLVAVTCFACADGRNSSSNTGPDKQSLPSPTQANAVGSNSDANRSNGASTSNAN